MRSKQAATMSDVAREAGVALGTVSKVINGLPVGESYRLKVEAAVKKLDYQVNTSAKALKSNRSGFIALIIPNTINPFFAAFADYIEEALYQRGYKLLLCCADGIPDKEVDEIELKEFIGHTPLEVLGGVLLGILVGILVPA